MEKHSLEFSKEWIDQYNKKCAEFLGYVNTTPTDPDFDIYEKKGGEVGNLIEPKSCKFHSDWNWIMEVIKEIVKIPDGIGYQFKRSVEGCFDSKEEVIQSIDQFINWYNKQK